MSDGGTAVGWSKKILELRQQKFLRDAIGLSIGRGLNLVIGAIAMLVFGIVFAKPEIAAISLFQMVAGLVVAFGVTWSSVGITRFGREELSEQKSLNYTSSTRLYIVLPIVVFATFGILLFRDSILQYIGVSSPAFIWYMLASIYLIAAHDHLTSLLTAREMHQANAMFFVAQGFGRLCVLIAYYFEFAGASVLGYLAALVWLDAIWLLLRLPHCARPYSFPLTKCRRKDIWKFVRYTGPQLYGFAALYVINWIDVYFIRKHGTMDGLGAYQFMYEIFLKLCAFALLVNALLFPRMMAWKLERPEMISKLMRQAPQILFFSVSLGCAALLVIFPAVLDFFFGSKYQIAYSSFALLTCAVPFSFLSFLFVPVLNSFDRVKTIQWVNILAAGCNLVMDYVLVPRHGIIGAAVATLAAHALVTILLMYAVNEQFKVRVLPIMVMATGVLAFAAYYYVSAVAT